MKTVRIKVFKFDELKTEKARRNAINWYLEGETFDYIFGQANKTVEIFCKIFNISLKDFDWIRPYRNRLSFNLDDTILELSGQRLATYIWNNYKSYIFRGKYYGKLVKTFKDGSPIPTNKEHPAGVRHVLRYSKCTLEHSCVLTGWCYDEFMLDPIYKFLSSPKDHSFKDLLCCCFTSIIKDVQGEYEASQSDEAVIENITSNEYEFTADGKIF